MAEDNKPGKAEAEKPKPKPKPPEYRRFEQLLKKVVKAPPLPRKADTGR